MFDAVLKVARPIWRFRPFILASIKSELRGRFVRSKLGALWHILQPLAQAAIFALILTEVLSSKLPHAQSRDAYAVHLLAGMAAWTLFSEILNRCLTVFIEYSSALKKISFPRISLPLIIWGGALVHHVLLLAALVIVLAFFGRFPDVYWLAIIPGIVLISVMAFGIGLLLGIFNVFVRDVGQIMAVVMQIWFWLTPIVYPIEALPERLRVYVQLNPMAYPVKIYQDAILAHRWPDATTLIWPTLFALTFFCLAFFVFQRANSEIVDAL